MRIPGRDETLPRYRAGSNFPIGAGPSERAQAMTGHTEPQPLPHGFKTGKSRVQDLREARPATPPAHPGEWRTEPWRGLAARCRLISRQEMKRRTRTRRALCVPAPHPRVHCATATVPACCHARLPGNVRSRAHTAERGIDGGERRFVRHYAGAEPGAAHRRRRGSEFGCHSSGARIGEQSVPEPRSYDALCLLLWTTARLVQTRARLKLALFGRAPGHAEPGEIGLQLSTTSLVSMAAGWTCHGGHKTQRRNAGQARAH